MKEERTARSDRMVAKIKNNPVIAGIIVFGIIVIAIGSFTVSLAKVYDSLKSFWPIDNNNIYIISQPEFVFSKEELLEEYEFGMNYRDTEDYSLAVLIKAKFKSELYNNPTYLNGISNIAKIKSDNSSIKIGSIPIPKEKEIDGVFQKILIAKFKKKPNKNDDIRFLLGPTQWTVKIGNQKWEEFVNDNSGGESFYGATGQVDILLEDPTWPILKSAKLYRGVDDNTWILDVTIDNRSHHSFSMDFIDLSISHPRSSHMHGIIGDPVKSVTLDWDRIIDTKGENGITSTINEEPISIRANFNDRGKFTSYYFDCSIPVNNSYLANESGKVIFKLKELPQINKSAKKSGSGGLFDSLSSDSIPVGKSMFFLHWRDMKIIVQPDTEIFPNSIEIQRIE